MNWEDYYTDINRLHIDVNKVYSIKSIDEIKLLKHQATRNQRYELAACARDRERIIILEELILEEKRKKRTKNIDDVLN